MVLLPLRCGEASMPQDQGGGKTRIRSTAAMSISRERPHAPKSYGLSSKGEGMLSWQWAEERLAAARNYWVASASPEGTPHAMPVWALWRDGALWFATDRESRKGRNLSANPQVVAHLESGDEVVILQGVAQEAIEPVLLEAFAATYERKYSFRPEVTPEALKASVVYALRPAAAFAWRERDYPQSATRFLFGG